MTPLLGTLGIGLALLAAILAGLLAIGSARFESRLLLRLARWSVGIYLLLISAACGLLAAAFLNDDFSLSYVAGYSERALPTGYKLAALWAGQSGSLLLWTWMLGAAAVIYVIRGRRQEPGVETGAALATLAVVLGFFAALMLYAGADGNPFTPSPVVPADGRGLNPMLQDPAMIAHPPFLFLGYAGFAVPLAILVGALAAGRRDNQWVAGLRRWTLASWLFLSVGILLGAQWAYYELGWGGYWAWDPVENASLLPWLTSTALLHSLMVQQHRGMLKMWNAVLVILSFLLCIFGTYLTRSGVVSSVHAFGASVVGTLFLVFLAVAGFASVVLLIWRRKLLASERPMETLLGREGMFLAANVLLVGMMLLTLIGTIFPVFSGFIAAGASADGEAVSQSITITASFYNKVVVPLGMVLVALMATAPLLVYGREAAGRLMRGMIVPAVLAAGAVGFAVFRGLGEPWALICIAVATVGIVNILIDFSRTLLSRWGKGEGLIVAILRVFDVHHRRHGAQLAHLGMILMVAGITASSLFADKHLLRLSPGQSAEAAGRTVQFEALEELRRANYTTVAATVRLTEPDGTVRTFTPERRFYDKSEQPSAEVAIESTWREDVYVTLAGWENAGAITAIEILINPLVSWMWVGGAVLTLGGLLALVPRFGREHAAEEAAVPASTGRSRPVRGAPVGEPVGAVA